MIVSQITSYFVRPKGCLILENCSRRSKDKAYLSHIENYRHKKLEYWVTLLCVLITIQIMCIHEVNAQDTSSPKKISSLSLLASDNPLENGAEGQTMDSDALLRSQLLTEARSSLFDSTNYVVLPKGVFVRQKDGDVPAHSVVISKQLQIGRHEVTQLQWEAIMGYNPSDVVNPYNPVESISWFEVNAFMDSLNSQYSDAFKYRLPTEAEWEYACLAGSISTLPIDEAAWFYDNSDERPHPVKQKAPNLWGLYDMRGNVWEWVSDWYALYDPKNNIDPESPGEGRARIIRGGSWWSPAEITTCTHRGNLAPDYKAIILGFRVVREANIEINTADY